MFFGNLMHDYYFDITSAICALFKPNFNPILYSQMENNSVYFQSLEYMLKCYGHFVLSLRDYLALRSPDHKLHSYFQIWTHPKGIYNLIHTLSLQYAHHLTPESNNILTAGISAFTHPASELPFPASSTNATLEVLNPRFQNNDVAVKVEERLEDTARYVEPSEPSAEESVVSYRSYKRGPYKSYSMAEKELAVQMLKKGVQITEISRKLHIPCKNIKRWSTEGIYRKSGGGRRRSSPLMEDAIRRWITSQYAPGDHVELDRVQEYALAISGDKNFKASRGWLSKFIDRTNLRIRNTFH